MALPWVGMSRSEFECGGCPARLLAIVLQWSVLEMKLLHPLEGVQWMEFGRITVVQEP